MEKKQFYTRAVATPPCETGIGVGSRGLTDTIEGAPTPKLLSISPVREDHDLLRGILDGRCQVSSVATCQEALSFLCHDRAAVIFCEADLLDGVWKDILSYIADLTDPPV